MSIPKSKMLSASKSIMAIASLKRDTQRTTQQQKQVVNINVQPPIQPTTVHYPAPYEVEEGITVVPPTVPPTIPSPVQPNVQQQPAPTVERKIDESLNPYAEIGELQSVISNNETAVKALIMIIDIMQSNPLIINKLIVAYAEPFKELIKVLTNADDVDVQYVDDVGCFASSKYNLVEDIYVIKNVNGDVQTQSLKYGYPDVLRLFDRFKISVKMIAVSQ